MTVTKVIRYTTKPECAEENARLIHAVFDELAATNPPGLHYTALRLEDGISFVHFVTLDGEQNPLTESPAFASFQTGINERCTDGPTPADATPLGAYSPR